MCPLAPLLVVLAATADAPEPPVPADPPARWWRGNLHTHSFWSDGNDFPEMIVDWYRGHDYHFLALSDHNTLSRGERWLPLTEVDRRSEGRAFDRYLQRWGRSWVRTRTNDGLEEVRLAPLTEFRALVEQADRFLLIEGEEITDHFDRKPIHLGASNLAEVIAPRGGESVVEVMKNNVSAVKEQSDRLGIPILAHLNHPNFGYGVTAEELAEVVEEHFFEVYNGHPGVNHLGDDDHPGVERIWDLANALRLGELGAPPLFGLATDDSHNYFGTSGSSPGRGWVMVRATHLTPGHLIAAIEAGDFYASSGVVLDDVRDDPENGTLEVKVDPAPDASYTIEFIGSRAGGSPDDIGVVFERFEGTEARYTLSGSELYVRAVVSSSLPPENPSFDGQVRQAWTQPVGWLSRIESANAAEQD